MKKILRCHFHSPLQNKRQYTSALKISYKNIYELLKAVAGDCAGALEILPKNAPCEPHVAYEEISKDQLGVLIELPKRPLLAGEDGIMSLAGAQPKIPLVRVGSQIFL